ncbi:hypothetical protein [Sphingomonas sp.]|jgi:hypothetical protein|uniref:hypothetical protein n=1 Tax=Sphingomonas sp. TaxID=28214 RepID=UPI003561E7F2
MALGRIAVHDIAVAATDETLFDFTEASSVDVTVCNRNATSVTIRLAVIDGAIGALASEDYVYYDFTVNANDSQPLMSHEAISANELIMVRASNTGVSFRLSGRGA